MKNRLLVLVNEPEIDFSNGVFQSGDEISRRIFKIVLNTVWESLIYSFFDCIMFVRYRFVQQLKQLDGEVSSLAETQPGSGNWIEPITQ